MPGYKPWKLQIISRTSLNIIPLLKIIIVLDSITDHVVDTKDTSDDVVDDDGVAYDGRRQQCKQRVMVSQAAAVVLSGWVITGSSS